MVYACCFSVFDLSARPNPFEGPDDFDVVWHYTAPEAVVAEVVVDGMRYPAFPSASTCNPIEKQDLVRVNPPHVRHVFVVRLMLEGTLMAQSTFVWEKKRPHLPELRPA